MQDFSESVQQYHAEVKLVYTCDLKIQLNNNYAIKVASTIAGVSSP